MPEQTDSSPYYTSTGEHVNVHGIAVSRDLLARWGGPLNYGDVVYIEGYGVKVVNDCMAARNHNAIDIWVATYDEEKRVGVKKGSMWLVRPLLMKEK